MTERAEREPGFDPSRPGESFVETVRRVATEPASFFDRVTGEARVWPPIIFALVCGLVAVVLGLAVEAFVPIDFGPFGGPMSGAFGGDPVQIGGAAIAALVIGGIVFAPLLILLGLYISAAIYQLLIRLIVGKENAGYWATFKINAYTLGVASLVSWIPVAGLLAGLYSFYLVFVGIREAHAASTGQAAAVAIIVFLVFGANLLVPTG